MGEVGQVIMCTETWAGALHAEAVNFQQEEK